MIRKTGLIILMVFGAAMLLPGPIFASDYAHRVEAGEVTVAWTLEGDQLHLELSAETEGWVSIRKMPWAVPISLSVRSRTTKSGSRTIMPTENGATPRMKNWEAKTM